MVLFDKITLDLELIIKPVIYIFVGFIIYEIIRKILNNAEKKSNIKKKHHQKRVKTINTLILNIVKYIIIIFIILAILATYGINIKTILAGLGLTAAIIGLAFQDIAKDFLAGISIILEDQYEIGDTVEINDFVVEVVSLGLRTTRIKNYKGHTKIIANHLITELINYNLYNNLAVIDISVAYEEDLDKVEKVINSITEDIKKKVPHMRGNIKILGVNELESSGVIYRVAIEVPSAEHFEVERILRKEIKKALDKAKIKIPYQQIEVHNGSK